MATKRRQEKVSEFIRKEAASLLLQELNDPRLGFITVTAVEITPDLRQAKIYYSVLGSNIDKEKTHKAVEAATGFLRRGIGKALDIRSVPEIQFIQGQNEEKKKDSILDLIEKVRAEDSLNTKSELDS